MGYKINGDNVVGFEKTLVGEKLVPATAADAMKTYGSKNSFLEKKAFLQFEYPNEADPNGPPIMIRLPFFEDPEIRESKTARYASYRPLSRASELFSYLGSDARQFSLTFKMTLPHLANMFNFNKESTGPATGDRTAERKKFFENASLSVPTERVGPKSSDYTDAFSPTTQRIKQNKGSSVLTEEDFTSLGYPLTYAGYAALDRSRLKESQDLKDILAYWVDIIRSSTYNNVTNPIYGPPIVRLTFGMLYRAIPCIVSNYSMTFDPNTGYDKDTLIPRVIKIDMELKEIRTGDFEVFNAATPSTAAGENLAGWESVITTSNNELGGTLDVLPVIGL